MLKKLKALQSGNYSCAAGAKRLTFYVILRQVFQPPPSRAIPSKRNLFFLKYVRSGLGKRRLQSPHHSAAVGALLQNKATEKGDPPRDRDPLRRPGHRPPGDRDPLRQPGPPPGDRDTAPPGDRDPRPARTGPTCASGGAGGAHERPSSGGCVPPPLQPSRPPPPHQGARQQLRGPRCTLGPHS